MSKLTADSKLTPVDKLDLALNVLANIPDGHIYKSLLEITPLLPIIEAEMIFNKLIKDGYAVKRESVKLSKFDQVVDSNYAATFDGPLMFFQQGGYTEQLRKDEYKKLIEEKLYKTTIDSNVSSHSVNRLFWATLIVAAAGVVAPWLDYINDKDINALKQKIEVLQSEQQQKQRQLFYNPAKP